MLNDAIRLNIVLPRLAIVYSGPKDNRAVSGRVATKWPQENWSSGGALFQVQHESLSSQATKSPLHANCLQD